MSVGGTVLVSGGTGGLGGAVVAGLLDAGRRVTATYREEAAPEALAGLAGPDRLRLVRADVTYPDAVARAVAECEDLAAVVDLVGGYTGSGLLHESDPADFDRMLRINLTPAVLLAHAALPRLLARGGGELVVVGSRAGVRPFAGAAAYVTAKAALHAFVQALDAEYRASNIRCNAVLPSVIATAANRTASPAADPTKWVPPEEIARVITFLVSEESAPVSGALLPVYGRA